MTPAERDLAIRTMLAEAGSQGPAGLAAVGSVILNRAKSGKYGQGVGGVVVRPNQFEPWNESNRGGENDPRRFKASDPAYQEAGDLLDGLHSGVIPDVTKGATHFYAPQAQADLGRAKPAWAQGPGRRLGGHVFYNADAGSDPSGFDAVSRSAAPTTLKSPSPVAPSIGEPSQLASSGAAPAIKPPVDQSFGGWMKDDMAGKRANPLLFRLFNSMFTPSSPAPGVAAASASALPGSLTPGAGAGAPTIAPPAADLPASAAINAGPAPIPAPASASMQPMGDPAQSSPGQYFTTPKSLGGGQEAGAPGGAAAMQAPASGPDMGLLGKLLGGLFGRGQ